MTKGYMKGHVRSMILLIVTLMISIHAVHEGSHVCVYDGVSSLLRWRQAGAVDRCRGRDTRNDVVTLCIAVVETS
jgi:hypothetical protein